MTGRIDSLGRNYVPSETIFAGEHVSDMEWVTRLVTNASRLSERVFNRAPTQVQVSQAISEVMTSVNEVSGGSFVNAEEVVIAADTAGAGQGILNGRRLLAETVYLGLRDSKEGEFHDALFEGSVDAIEDVLPDQLKPIAREVRNLVITNPDLRIVVDELDAIADEESWDTLPPSVDDVVKVLSRGIDELRNLSRNIPPEDKDEYSLIMRSLRARREVAEQTKGRGQPLIAAPTGGRDAMDPRLFQTDAKSGPSGQAQLYKELQGVALDAPDRSAIFDFVNQVSGMLRRNPLGWAGGWQQVAPYVSSMIDNQFPGQDSPEYFETKKYAEALLTVSMYETAIYHCDESLEAYLQLLPPVESMTNYVWNEGYRKELTKDPLINSVYKWMYEDAYNVTGKAGEKSPAETLLEVLQSPQSIDEYCTKMAEDITKDAELMGEFRKLYLDHNFGALIPEQVRDKVRTSMALFIVDEYPLWMGHLNRLSTKTGKPDWIESTIVQRRANAGDETSMVPVRLFSSDRIGAYKTCIAHPFLALQFPGNVLRLKGGSYGEEVLQEYEKGMGYVAVSKFSTYDKAKDPNVKDVTEIRWNHPSEIGGKQIGRYSKAATAIVGDLYGSGFEGFKDLEVAVQQLQNMDPSSERWKYDEVGWVVSKFLECKLIAARAGDPREAWEIWSANIALVSGGDVSELAKVAQEVTGADKAGAFGVLRDLRAQYGLKIGTKELQHRLKEFMTGVKGPRAETAFALNNGSQMLVALMNTAIRAAGKKSPFDSK